MNVRRNSRSLRPTVDRLEEYCLMAHTGLVSTLAHVAVPIVQSHHNNGHLGHSQPVDLSVAPLNKPTGLVHTETDYTKGPVNSTGSYKTRFDDRLRFFYATATTFNTSSINSAALALTAKPLSGTSSHNTGDFYVTPAVGKSFFVMWNNVTANRYDWLAVKYLGNGSFATLDRLGNSTTVNNNQSLTRNYTSGGSSITLLLTNPTGSIWFANDFTYSLKFKNA